MLCINLSILPVACGRPRLGLGGRVYTPKKTQLFKNEVKYQLLADKCNLKWDEQIAEIYNEPLKLEVIFKMPIPKSYQHGSKKIAEGTRHIKKPDTDNLIKALKDCMSGIIFRDDRQVCHEVIYKRYSYNPGMEITIEKYKLVV